MLGFVSNFFEYNNLQLEMQVTNKYAIENNIPVEELFQIAISQYTKNADKLAIEEEISNFLFFDTFFINRNHMALKSNIWVMS